MPIFIFFLLFVIRKFIECMRSNFRNIFHNLNFCNFLFFLVVEQEYFLHSWLKKIIFYKDVIICNFFNLYYFIMEQLARVENTSKVSAGVKKQTMAFSCIIFWWVPGHAAVPRRSPPTPFLMIYESPLERYFYMFIITVCCGLVLILFILDRDFIKYHSAKDKRILFFLQGKWPFVFLLLLLFTGFICIDIVIKDIILGMDICDVPILSKLGSWLVWYVDIDVFSVFFLIYFVMFCEKKTRWIRDKWF